MENATVTTASIHPSKSESDHPGCPPSSSKRETSSLTSLLVDGCFTFLDVSSIRGIRNTFRSPLRPLRILWTSFILLSFLLLLIVIVFCASDYLTYHTVMRQHKRPIFGKDFPVMILCSDGLFGDTDTIKTLADHPRIYDSVISRELEKMLIKGKYKSLNQLAHLRSTVFYNVNNLDLMEQLMKDVLAMRHFKDYNVLTRALKGITCSINFGRLCQITPFYNLKFRNCLAFQVPNGLNDAHFHEIVVEGFLMSKRHQNIMPPPADSDSFFLAGQHLSIFLHRPGTLPSSFPNFVVSMETNRWILIDFDATHIRRANTPVSHCAPSPLPLTRHAGTPVTLSPDVCRALAIRQKIRDSCGCEYYEPPFDVWPLGSRRHFCGRWKRSMSRAAEEIRCMFSQMFSTPTNESCLAPCSHTDYLSRINVIDLDQQMMHRIHREMEMAQLMVKVKQRCGRRVHRGCDETREVLGKLLENSSASIDDYRIPVRLAHHDSMKDLLKTAVPKIPFNSSVALQKTRFYISLRCPRESVVEEREQTVHSIWTTLAQIGGASSFLAGFSFAVVAEVIDTVVKLYLHRKKAKT